MVIFLKLLGYVYFVYCTVDNSTKRPKHIIQGDQLNMAMVFRYLLKSNFSSVHVHSSVSLDKKLFKRYQKNTAMFNW